MNRSGMPSLRVVWHSADGNLPPRRRGSGMNGRPPANGKIGGAKGKSAAAGGVVQQGNGRGESDRADGGRGDGAGDGSRSFPAERQAFTTAPEKPGWW